RGAQRASRAADRADHLGHRHAASGWVRPHGRDSPRRSAATDSGGAGHVARGTRAPRARRGRGRRRVHREERLRPGTASRYGQPTAMTLNPIRGDGRAGESRHYRVLVVDDSAAQRGLLAALLDADPELEVVGTASDGAHAVAATAQLHPDVITMDLRMPTM